MAKVKLIYLGIKGSVIALDSATGEQVWVRELEGSSFVNVGLSGDLVIAATYGEVFALDSQTGAIRWHNPLKGYGLGMVTMVGADLNINSACATEAEASSREAGG